MTRIRPQNEPHRYHSKRPLKYHLFYSRFDRNTTQQGPFLDTREVFYSAFSLVEKTLFLSSRSAHQLFTIFTTPIIKLDPKMSRIWPQNEPHRYHSKRPLKYHLFYCSFEPKTTQKGPFLYTGQVFYSAFSLVKKQLFLSSRSAHQEISISTTPIIKLDPQMSRI